MFSKERCRVAPAGLGPEECGLNWPFQRSHGGETTFAPAILFAPQKVPVSTFSRAPNEVQTTDFYLRRALFFFPSVLLFFSGFRWLMFDVWRSPKAVEMTSRVRQRDEGVVHRALLQVPDTIRRTLSRGARVARDDKKRSRRHTSFLLLRRRPHPATQQGRRSWRQSTARGPSHGPWTMDTKI